MQWLAVVLMGGVLGLLGGGGGILTVPILVGLFGMAPTAATGASLFVVGLTSAAGAAGPLVKKEADAKSALLLALPSSAGAFAARKWLVPAIPERIGPIGKDDLLLGGFALLMTAVGIRMLMGQSGSESESEPRSPRPWLVGLVGLGIGLLSGALGAGGGFLILPALTLLLGLEMKQAVATSLAVIALQSLIGFLGELGKPIDWALLVPVTALAMAGMAAGAYLRPRAPGQQLRLAFAILVLAVAVWMGLRVALNHF